MAEFKIKKPEEVKSYKEVFPDARDTIKYAFTIGEIDYFEFDDFNSVPCERGFHALSFFTELSERCTREYLQAFVQSALDEFNNTAGIRITNVIKLVHQLQERLELLIEPNIAYKLCGVIFFDSTENPYRFNYKHCIEKANIFEKAPMDEFFFAQPITKLIPYTSSLGSDLETYLKTVNQINKEHLTHISTMLSVASKNSESFKWLTSQISKDSV